jgi:hypothetical protein
MPLVAAMRQLAKQSAPRNVSSTSLASQIKKTNAAWQYQVEAILLGRELDAGESKTSVQEKQTEHRDDG